VREFNKVEKIMLSSPLTKKKNIYTVRKIEKRVRRRRRD
jgi:hypothetical protein